MKLLFKITLIVKWEHYFLMRKKEFCFLISQIMNRIKGNKTYFMCSVASSETLVVLLCLCKKFLIIESTRFAGKTLELNFSYLIS